MFVANPPPTFISRALEFCSSYKWRNSFSPLSLNFEFKSWSSPRMVQIVQFRDFGTQFPILRTSVSTQTPPDIGHRTPDRTSDPPPCPPLEYIEPPTQSQLETNFIPANMGGRGYFSTNPQSFPPQTYTQVANCPNTFNSFSNYNLPLVENVEGYVLPGTDATVDEFMRWGNFDYQV